MSNPFSQFKPYKKHETSTWPLFSDWIDDHLDIATAPQQYLIYTAWLLGLGFSAWTSIRYNKMSKLTPNSVVSDMNKHQLLDQMKATRAKGLIMPLAVTFVVGLACSYRRNEEVDRSGERFQDYFTRCVYAGVSPDNATNMARNIVVQSATHDEGSLLCDLALHRLAQQGVIPLPNFDRNGIYSIPESVRQSDELQALERGASLQTSIVMPGEAQPVQNVVVQASKDAV